MALIIGQLQILLFRLIAVVYFDNSYKKARLRMKENAMSCPPYFI